MSLIHTLFFLVLLIQLPQQPFQLLDKDQVLRAMESADVVINLIGQDTDSRHFALEDVHETGAKIVAEAASTLGIQRLVHVSALGANPDSPSRFLASKVCARRRSWGIYGGVLQGSTILYFTTVNL